MANAVKKFLADFEDINEYYTFSLNIASILLFFVVFMRIILSDCLLM